MLCFDAFAARKVRDGAAHLQHPVVSAGGKAHALKGAAQHTVGVQNIRCFTIMQLLKGNIGIPGGGIIAMRGQPNVQASTDFGIEFNMQPGYLVAPTHKTNTLAKWTDAFGMICQAKM